MNRRMRRCRRIRHRGTEAQRGVTHFSVCLSLCLRVSVAHSLIIIGRAAFPAWAADADSDGIALFETKVRPVLVERCYKCHSAGAAKLKGKLRLDSMETMRAGGESGTAAVVPGKPEDSLLVAAIRQEEEGLQMPPKDKLPAEQIAAIEAWIKRGAPYPAASVALTTIPQATTRLSGMSLADGREFWSFKRPVEPKIPE